MHSQALPQTGFTISGVSTAPERPMPKRKAPEAATFGQRLVALRKAAAMTQQELADEVGVSRRMLAYYEGQSEHPPTTLLPALAQALHVSTDELLGLTPPLKPTGGCAITACSAAYSRLPPCRPKNVDRSCNSSMRSSNAANSSAAAAVKPPAAKGKKP